MSFAYRHFLFIICLALPLLAPTVSSAQELSASLGWGHFVQGMTGVRNDFTVTGPPAGTAGMFFYFFRETQSQPVIALPDFVPSNGWIQGYDMGNLPPGTKLTVYCVNLQGDTIGIIPPRDITVLPRPSWLEDAELSNVSVANRTVTMMADYLVESILNAAVPKSVTAIGGRRYSMYGTRVRMKIEYNLDTRASTATSPMLIVGINVFNQKDAYRGVTLPTGSVSLDTDFNLTVKASSSVIIPLFRLSIPRIYIPVSGFADLTFDADAALRAAIRGNIVVGSRDGRWGFVRDGDTATSVAATAFGSGRLRGGLSVLGGIFEVRGTLGIYGSLGGGIQYVTVPEVATQQVFGGDLNVWGELAGYIFFGSVRVARIGPEMLYQTTFGTPPGTTIADVQDGSLRAVTLLVDSTYTLPDHAPQPSLDAHNGNVVVAWVDDSSGATSLLLSRLNEARTAFSQASVILRNENSIGHPQVSVMPDGSALLVWTQSRYTPATLPPDVTLQQLLSATDVYAALYDAGTGSITPPLRMADDVSGTETGRPETSPRVCALDGTRGLAVWLAQTGDRRGSEVWYAPLNRTGAALTTDEPRQIAAVEGMNRGIQLAALGDGSAMAVWINDPDGSDSTYNDRMVYSVWNDGNWSTPALLAQASDRQSFNELALDVSGRFGTLAWTSTLYDTAGAFYRGLNAQVWDRQTGSWIPESRYTRWDSTSYVQSPSVAVAENGKVSVSYQVIPRSDTIEVDEGRRYILLRDLNEATGGWKEVPGLEFLSDTSAFVWNARSVFGDGDQLYVLTEEQGADDSTATAVRGVRFGDPRLGLVLRTLRLHGDLSLTDEEEPQTPSSVYHHVEEPVLQKVSAYPNPAATDLRLEYRVARRCQVTIDLYTMAGEHIGKLLEETVEPGQYQTQLDVRSLLAGSYTCRIRAGQDLLHQTITILR